MLRSIPDITGSPRYRWWVFWAIAAGSFLSVVDHGSVMVALPEIERYFDADLPTVQWVVIGYALSISVLLLPMGRLGDMAGRRRIYILGFCIFVVAAALAGSSRWLGLPTLITAKILQGIGSAMIQGNGMATIIAVFPGDQRGKVLGYHLSVVGAGAIAGPALGGLLISIWGWQSVFFINVPVGIVTIAVSALVLRDQINPGESGPSQRQTFDWLGALLSGAALLTALLTVGNGAQAGWTSPVILTGAGAAVLLFAAFIWWELRTPSPMLDLRLFRRKLFALGVAAGWISFLGSSASRFLMPFYLQRVLEFSPGQVGLLMIPPALALVLVGPFSGLLSDKFGWRILTVGGMALSTVAWFGMAALLGGDSPSGDLPGRLIVLIILMLVFQGAGTALFNSPNNNSILSAVERSSYGVVASLTQLIRNSANVTSVAVATTIVVVVMGNRGIEPSLDAVSPQVAGAFVAGLHWAFIFMGGALAVACAICVLRGERARPVAPVPEAYSGTDEAPKSVARTSDQ